METAIPKTMKAWVVTRNADPRSGLTLFTSRPTPSPPTGSDILIRVSHVSLNPADIHYMRILPLWIPFRRSPTIGLDFMGTIVSAGPSAPANLSPGTRVCGAMAVMLVAFGHGGLAEYVKVPASLVAAVPEGMESSTAAGLGGIAGQTAALIMKTAKVKEGYRVCIVGASGGVGSFLVQICSAKGAVVYGVCSGANADVVKRMGADEIIDYKEHHPVENHLAMAFAETPFDFVLDTVGDDALYAKSMSFLKPTGQFVTIVGGPSQGVMPVIYNKIIPFFTRAERRSWTILGLAPAGSYAREAMKLADEGLIRETLIDSEYPMEEAVEAYEKLATKHARGKVIVKVQS